MSTTLRICPEYAEFVNGIAIDKVTGEIIPDELIEEITVTGNLQVRGITC